MVTEPMHWHKLETGECCNSHLYMGWSTAFFLNGAPGMLAPTAEAWAGSSCISSDGPECQCRHKQRWNRDPIHSILSNNSALNTQQGTDCETSQSMKCYWQVDSRAGNKILLNKSDSKWLRWFVMYNSSLKPVRHGLYTSMMNCQQNYLRDTESGHGSWSRHGHGAVPCWCTRSPSPNWNGLLPRCQLPPPSL